MTHKEELLKYKLIDKVVLCAIVTYGNYYDSKSIIELPIGYNSKQYQDFLDWFDVESYPSKLDPTITCTIWFTSGEWLKLNNEDGAYHTYFEFFSVPTIPDSLQQTKRIVGFNEAEMYSTYDFMFRHFGFKNEELNDIPPKSNKYVIGEFDAYGKYLDEFEVFGEILHPNPITDGPVSIVAIRSKTDGLEFLVNENGLIYS